jgi:hypothetical protein
MNNTELLNTVEPTAEHTEELVNTANVNVELSEEQLHEIDGGGMIGWALGCFGTAMIAPVAVSIGLMAEDITGVKIGLSRALGTAGDMGSDLEDKIRK